MSIKYICSSEFNGTRGRYQMEMRVYKGQILIMIWYRFVVFMALSLAVDV